MPPEDVLVAALKLPDRERARLAAEILASLDGAPDADAEAAWAVEVERRAAEVESGAAKLEPWDDVLARVRRG